MLGRDLTALGQALGNAAERLGDESLDYSALLDAATIVDLQWEQHEMGRCARAIADLASAPPPPPVYLVSPETKAMLEAWRLPTYAEQCLALEMIRYKRRKAEKWARENPIPDDVWMTAFR